MSGIKKFRFPETNNHLKKDNNTSGEREKNISQLLIPCKDGNEDMFCVRNDRKVCVRRMS
jgi:hypothetical protein